MLVAFTFLFAGFVCGAAYRWLRFLELRRGYESLLRLYELAERRAADAEAVIYRRDNFIERQRRELRALHQRLGGNYESAVNARRAERRVTVESK